MGTLSVQTIGIVSHVKMWSALSLLIEMSGKAGRHAPFVLHTE